MMVKKQYIMKRILIIIIASLVAFSAVSMLATVIIYDSIFSRYDCSGVEIPKELTGMVETRLEKEYYSGENRLCGYLYKSDVKDKDTLVVMSTGFKACTDDYLWQIKSLLSYGWSVFIFDSTGSCSSQGDSTVGFSQAVYDMDATLNFLEKNNRFGYNNIVLIGHSRGGYAVCSALAMDYNIKAVVTVSGINSAMDGVIGPATEYVGPLSYGNYGFLWVYQAMIFGKDTLNLKASECINKSNVPVLIIHGSNDRQVPVDRYSIYSFKDEINSSFAEYILCSDEKQNGHVDLLFDSGGGENTELMSQINDFLVRSIK